MPDDDPPVRPAALTADPVEDWPNPPPAPAWADEPPDVPAGFDTPEPGP